MINPMTTPQAPTYPMTTIPARPADVEITTEDHILGRSMIKPKKYYCATLCSRSFFLGLGGGQNNRVTINKFSINYDDDGESNIIWCRKNSIGNRYCVEDEKPPNDEGFSDTRYGTLFEGQW